METFNIQRFGNVFLRLLMVRKKEYVKLFLGIILGVALTYSFAYNPFNLEAISYDYHEQTMFAATFFIFYGIIILFTVSGGNIISDLKTKQKRINELTLPATNLERFTARVLGVTIVPLVLTIVAFFVGDLLQMLINMLLHQGTYYSATKFMHEFLSNLIDNKILSFFYIDQNAYFAIIVMGIINMNAIYMLGGMLFRKTPWLQTSLVLMGNGMAFSALFLSYAFFVIENTEYTLYIPEWMQTTWWSIFINAIQIVLWYFLSYRIYCRLQAINTRWLNI